MITRGKRARQAEIDQAYLIDTASPLSFDGAQQVLDSRQIAQARHGVTVLPDVSTSILQSPLLEPVITEQFRRMLGAAPPVRSRRVGHCDGLAGASRASASRRALTGPITLSSTATMNNE
ncbi:hypothetical protein OKW28_000444 [Paraburkholderia sp. 40]